MKKKIRDIAGWARRRFRAHLGFVLSLRCLKLIYLKRYVGGLVQFDGSDVCISTLLELRFDDRVSASLFGRLPVIFDN